MKKILVTGVNSYVGTSVAKWLGNFPDEYEVDLISLRDETWRNKGFSEYDVVLHVAGIAHVAANSKQEELYYRVNRDLTIEIAEKSKREGVRQFIFMSSIIVYGDSSISKRIIYKDTMPRPSNAYGNSKLQAEEAIMRLESSTYKTAIVRPPMIYGKGSKGNYPKLVKLATILPIFPDMDNQRSMLHIDNLCMFLNKIIDNYDSGLFFPQNREYVRTSEMIKLIAEVHGKKIRLVKIFNPILKTLVNKVTVINKLFGNLAYDQSMSEYKVDYRIMDLKSTINASEK